MQYEHTTYNKLSDINAMRGTSASHMSELQSLGEVICEHGLEKVVGVTLVHRHYDVAPNERVVWNISDLEWTATPQCIADTLISPVTWKIEAAQPCASYAPLEFCPNNNQYLREIRAAEQVMAENSFLSRFMETALRLEVYDIFGLGVLSVRDELSVPGMIMYEESSKSKRTMTVRLVQKSTNNDIYGGITLWNFGTSSIDGVKSCWHGGSRHCCG